MAANGKRLAVLAPLVFMALSGNDVIHSAEGPPRGPDSAQAILTLKPGNVEISSVTFSPDGKRLAGACSDGTARVWDALTGKELLSIKAHEVSVRSIGVDLGDHRRVDVDGQAAATAFWMSCMATSMLRDR
jgi:WD40 repeat protein